MVTFLNDSLENNQEEVKQPEEPEVEDIVQEDKVPEAPISESPVEDPLKVDDSNDKQDVSDSLPKEEIKEEAKEEVKDDIKEDSQEDKPAQEPKQPIVPNQVSFPTSHVIYLFSRILQLLRFRLLKS
jgi:hypothetical protein